MRSQKGWVLFFIGILISTFLGGAVRVLLSPAFVRQWVDDLVLRSQPKFTFAFAEARMSFGSGWLPLLAIELSDLSVRAKDPCITGAEIQVSRLTVPLHLRSLSQGRVRFGDIEAEHVSYMHHPAVCPKGRPQTEMPFNVATEIAPLENFFQKRWSKEVVNTTKFLDTLRITELRFVRSGQIDPEFFLRDLYLTFSREDGRAELTFKFSPGVKAIGDQPVGPTEAKVSITSELVRWTSEGNLKEGQIQSSGQWVVDEGRYRFDLRWQDVPLTNFMGLMYRWNLSQLAEFKAKNAWFTCGLHGEGDVRKALTTPLKSSECEIYGDLGRARVKPAVIYPQKVGDTSYQLDIEQLDLRRLGLAMGHSQWPAYVSKLGTFSGTLEVILGRAFKAMGVARNIEFYWGDFGLPGRRSVIASADFKAEGKVGDYKVILSEIQGGLPPGMRLEVRRKDELVAADLKIPAVEFSKDWPLVAEVTRQLDVPGRDLAFRDFQLSTEKEQDLKWKIAGALPGKARLTGQGLLINSSILQGRILYAPPGAKRRQLVLTGTVQEPSARLDQTP